MHPRYILTILACAAAVAGLSPAAAAVSVIRVPHGGIQPRAAVAADGTVHMIYFVGKPAAGDIFYVSSGDGCKTFSDPVQVNSQKRSVRAKGTIRGPQLALGRGGRVHVAWMGSKKARPKVNGKHTPLLYARLTDKGTAFEKQRNIITFAHGLDGGVSVAADPKGNVYVVWHAGAGEDREEKRRVWVARSDNDGKTFAKERAVSAKATGACGCCGMQAHADGVGNLYILYRTATKAVERDMVMLSSKDGKTFASTMVAPWHTGQCVLSLAAVSTNQDQGRAAWERHRRVFWATINGKTGTLSEPVQVTNSGRKQKFPAVIANAKGETLVAWAEGAGWLRGGTLVWQVYDADGKPTKDTGRLKGIPTWSFPAAIPRRDGSFVIMY